MDRDYFKVKQPEWIATDAPIHDIKTCSISGAITAFRCEQLQQTDMLYYCLFPVYLTSCYDPIDILDSALWTGSRWTYLRPAGHFLGLCGESQHGCALVARKGGRIKQ